MGDQTVRAVLQDYRTADIDERTRAMLGFLEKLTLHPDGMEPADAAALVAVGISKRAALDAIYICFLFNLIDRVADTLSFATLSPEELARAAKMQLHRGRRRRQRMASDVYSAR